MSDLKFTCPSCGQHVRCDQSYAGERIPCPSCAAVIRVPVDAPVVPDEPMPEAVPPTPLAGGAPSVPTLEDNFASEAPLPTAPPLTEREKQIAAARAEHPVLAMPQVKPRLSYILSGGEAPPSAENESATHPEQNHSEHTEHPHHNSLSE